VLTDIGTLYRIKKSLIEWDGNYGTAKQVLEVGGYDCEGGTYNVTGRGSRWRAYGGSLANSYSNIYSTRQEAVESCEADCRKNLIENFLEPVTPREQIEAHVLGERAFDGRAAK
jgi:hypothetical protein